MDLKAETRYVASIMEAPELQVMTANKSHLKALTELVCAIEAEDHPGDATAALTASEGVRQSLSRFDALNSDCVWCLIAFSGDRPVGLAILTRTPKLDARIGFLYLDEIHVMRQYRRQGIGKALLSGCRDVAQEAGLAGIRLLARIDNEPARRLYESAGFRGNETMLYQFQFDPPDPQP
ncbi:GNAT family N-acetyltransferase [Candidatus Bipolaricaulota bacterium]